MKIEATPERLEEEEENETVDIYEEFDYEGGYCE